MAVLYFAATAVFWEDVARSVRFIRNFVRATPAEFLGGVEQRLRSLPLVTFVSPCPEFRFL